MQHFGDNFLFVIPPEGDVLHTQEHPFCAVDPACPCHEDQELISEVNKAVINGLFTPDEATRFVRGEML